MRSSRFAHRTRVRPPSERAIRRLLLTDAVAAVNADSRGVYGYRRVQAALRIESDLVVNHKLVASIMAQLGFHRLPRRRSRRRNLVSIATSSDLVNRDSTTTAANQLWVTDMPKPHHRSPRLCVRGLGCLLTKISGLGDQQESRHHAGELRQQHGRSKSHHHP